MTGSTELLHTARVVRKQLKASRLTYDLIGQTFGKWSVVSRSDLVGTGSIWNCICICGTERAVRGYVMVSGQSRSCGCISNKRGQPVTGRRPTHYRRWHDMLSRCRNKNHKAYKYYGAKGVFVCSRWSDGEDGLSGFQCFVADIGDQPSPIHSIDRWPDNAGPYSPDNFRWATPYQQTHNRRPSAV